MVAANVCLPFFLSCLGVVPKAVRDFDSLISHMMCAYSESRFSEDIVIAEQIIDFIIKGRVMQIVLRNAGNWYMEYKRMRVFFENLLNLIPRVCNWVFAWNFGFPESDTGILEMYNCDQLMKQELDEAFCFPNIQSLSNVNSHHLQRIFLHFLVEVLNDRYIQKLLQLHKPNMNGFYTDMVTLSKDLSFFMTYLFDIQVPYPQFLNEVDVRDEIQDIANRAGQLCYLLFTGKINIQISVALSDLMLKIELIKEKVKAHVQEMWSAKSRTWTNCELVIGSGNALVEYLNGLLKENPDLILSVKPNVEILTTELRSLVCFCMDPEQEIKNEDFKNLMTHIAGVIERADYLIGSILVHSGHVWYFNLMLQHVLGEVDTIKTKISQIEENQKCYLGTLGASIETSVGNSAQAVSSVKTEVILDFDQEQEIKDELIGKPCGLKVVSIVGMPGLGKTTLARKLYGDPTIIHKFHVRLFCTVSPAYQKRLLLLDIIRSLGEPVMDWDKHKNDSLDGQTDEELAEIMYQGLKGKRYILIMDDVWDMKPWYDFLVSLPDDNTGSRVIFTSRNEDLSLQGKPHKILKLSFLSEDRSWYLLRQNLFQNGECPLDLEEIGKEIANKCQGLPLLLNLVAGLLKETNGKLEAWDVVSRSFSSHMDGDSNVINKILEQSERLLEHSYESLPYILKPCFLYCGCFPKEKAISVKKLKLLWVAEGFIPKFKEVTPEDAAENCLTDLINRGLLLVADRKSDGSVKTCRIHALLHDFCLRKAEEMHFLKMIDRYLAIYDRDRRLVISNPNCCGLFTSVPLGPTVCSLVAYLTFESNNGPYDVSFLFCGFKLLRVLDLEELEASMLPQEIGRLVLLEYLAIRCCIRSIPMSVCNLQNLETFIVNADTILHPRVLCGLSKLRHLYFSKDYYAFSSRKDEYSTFQFPSVQTLSCVSFSDQLDVDLLRRFPNLRRLRCSLEPCTILGVSRFPVLDFLDKLETLNVSQFDLHKRVISTLSLPSCLGQLTLSTLGLPWKELSAIGRSLPKLRVLKLLKNAFDGCEWDMESDEVEFPELRFLKMERLNIRKWKIASVDEFPKLQRLLVFNCPDLDEIPGHFADMQSLQSIEIRGCKSSTNKSAMEIKEIQQDYNEAFQVFIVPEVPSTDPEFLQFISRRDTKLLEYWQQLGIENWFSDGR